MRMKHAMIGMSLALLTAFGVAACTDDEARVASRNLSQSADNFGISRRIVFYNGLNGEYLLVIEGLCSQEQTDRKLTVTCKVGDNAYKKHFLGLADNITYFSEQLDGKKVSTYHYTVTWNPSTLLPKFDVR